MINVIDDGDVQYLVLVQIDERDLPLFCVEIREVKSQQSQQHQYESRRFHLRSRKETSLKNQGHRTTYEFVEQASLDSILAMSNRELTPGLTQSLQTEALSLVE